MKYKQIRLIDRKTGESDKDYFLRLGKDYNQRRKVIYEKIMETGHPSAINQTTYAKSFGVSNVSIHKDIKAIKKEFREIIGQDAKVITGMIYDKALQELVKKKNYLGAIKALESFNNWLFDIGKQKKVTEEVNLNIKTAWEELHDRIKKTDEDSGE